MKVKTFLLLFLIIPPIFGWALTGIEGQVETKIYVDPPVATATPGGTFTVNIKVVQVKNLYTYQFKLSWEPSLLNVISVTEGPFLNAEGTYKTYFDKKIWNEPDPKGVRGYIYVACSLLGEPATAAASGGGTLATVEFIVKEGGNSSLHLYETLLLNVFQIEMPHETEDGYFQYPPPTEIVVKPSVTINASLVPGNTFKVNVSVIRGVDLYAWSLNMSWDPALLNVTNIEESSFLSQSVYNTIFNTQIHQEEGWFSANCSLFGEPPEASASGNGTLISVNFLVEAVGITVLDLHDTMLWDHEGVKLFHVAWDGYFVNVLKDVSIVSVEASLSMVKAGDYVSITVIAKNKGDMTENFDVTVYCNSSNLGTLSTSDLNPGAEKTLTFSWNTEDATEGNYTIKAVASTVLWETNTEDNVYVDGHVMVTAPEQTFPFMQILIVIVIIIGVVVTGVILLRKKR